MNWLPMLMAPGILMQQPRPIGCAEVEQEDGTVVRIPIFVGAYWCQTCGSGLDWCVPGGYHESLDDVLEWLDHHKQTPRGTRAIYRDKGRN
jgi:hypothetical protein